MQIKTNSEAIVASEAAAFDFANEAVSAGLASSYEIRREPRLIYGGEQFRAVLFRTA